MTKIKKIKCGFYGIFNSAAKNPQKTKNKQTKNSKKQQQQKRETIVICKIDQKKLSRMNQEEKKVNKIQKKN